MKTIFLFLITITMNAQSFTPIFEGFSTPPIVNCVDIISGDVVTLVFEHKKAGISNSTKLIVYLPYIAIEDYEDLAFIINNGVIEAAHLTIKKGTNAAVIIPTSLRPFAASGHKAVWFRIAYKIKQPNTDLPRPELDEFPDSLGAFP